MMSQDFLKLNLQFFLLDKDNSLFNQEKINLESNLFLNTYPNSKFEHFVRYQIKYEFVLSDWGFGMDLFSGYGWYTEELKESFTGSIPIGFGVDVFYKDFVFNLRYLIGFSFTKKDLDFNGHIWKNNSQVRLYIPEISFGYNVYEDNLIKLTPFGGISGISFSPTEYDMEQKPELKNAVLGFVNSFTYGINLDLKLFTTTSVNYSGPEQDFWLIKIRLASNYPQFMNKYDRFDGNIYYLTIGFGGFGHTINRNY